MGRLRRDTVIVLVLLGISLVTHFAALTYPREVIFDEVHFGKFITAYCCTGERFFDIHPPHAKLLIAGAAWLGGYRGGFSFENIGQAYGNIQVAAMRVVPAVAGTILPLIVYWLLRQLSIGSVLALLGAGLIVLDNALTIQTRIIALDGVLLCATFGSLCAYLQAQGIAQGPRRIAYYILAGALCGLAVGTKFTGLAAPALLGLLILGKMIAKPKAAVIKEWLMVSAVIVASMLVVYGAGWALHFALLPLPGSGDAFHVPTSLLAPNTPDPISFVRETVALHKVMLQANYGLTATHPNASAWWSWPLMQMPVFYWTGDDGLKQIYFVGNPLVWWGASILFFVSVVVTFMQFGQRRAAPAGFWLLTLGFAIAMLPLVRVPRALFLYHYLTPLIFSLLAGLVWLHAVLVHANWQPRRVQQLTAAVLVVALAGFILVLPLTYGTPLGDTPEKKESRLHSILFWLPRPGSPGL